MALNNFCKWCSGCYYILSAKSFILWSIRAPNLNLNGMKHQKVEATQKARPFIIEYTVSNLGKFLISIGVA